MNTIAQTRKVTLCKHQALAEFLNVAPDNITRENNDRFTTGHDTDLREYQVLTPKEADNALLCYIGETLWAFNSDFILTFAKIHTEDASQALQQVLGKLCEAGNPLVLAVIGGQKKLKKFAAEAVKADGRGHFLSAYDGIEHSQNGFFIYRQN
jgi:hypothetical protein